MNSAPLPITPNALADRARRGPRYTSYPPATELNKEFTFEQAKRELDAGGDGPISLYCHIPYCRSLCWYCGCNVKISRDRVKGTSYVDTLIKELRMLAGHLGKRQQLTQLALGGGSPNFLLDGDLRRLVATIREHFDVASDAELGIELDPRDSTVEMLSSLSQLGFTRVSVGVQDYDPVVQEAINRFQTVEQTADLVKAARDLGFNNINFDLVYGLPAQTPSSFSHTIDAVVACAPQQIALFGYAHLPSRAPHQRLVTRAHRLPNAVERAELMLFAAEKFEDAGYIQVGIDHFARPDSRLAHAALEGNLHRNFQGYVERRAERLYGCGSSAITDSGNAYWQNHTDIKLWQQGIDAGELPIARGLRLDDDDQIRRYAITRLMCDAELAMDQLERKFDIKVADYFAKELEVLSGPEFTDLVELDVAEGWLSATAMGCQLLRNICMVFDRYNWTNGDGVQGPRFSPTV